MAENSDQLKGDKGADQASLSGMGGKFVIKDPVHGSIELNEKLKNIIDRPEFQRLRKIKQLGGACYVYPGAVHTRFEHSIGVCFIAGELLKKLEQDGLPIPLTPEDVLCVQIAALCHDLGHGPFSHLFDTFLQQAFEGEVPPRDEKLLQHEYRSVMMLESIMENLGDEFPVKEKEDKEFIKALITFDKKCATEGVKEVLKKWNPKDMGRNKDYVFLFEIVANGFTGIDVDKMDYFSRDSHGCGLYHKFDWRRYIQSTKVLKCDMDGETVHRLCTRDKDEHNICELFHIRYVLYFSVYQHKTTVIVQDRIVKALLHAKDFIKFKGKDAKYYSIKDCIEDPEAFTQLTDSIQDLIMLGPDVLIGQQESEILPNVEKAREIFREIQERDLPRFVGRKRYRSTEGKTEIEIGKKRCKKEELEEEFKKHFAEAPDGTVIDEKRLTVLFEKFESKERDVMKKHFFYGKNEERGSCLPAQEWSDLWPKSTDQSEVFVYYDPASSRETEKLKNLARALKKF